MELITYLIIGELLALISIANWSFGIRKELTELNKNLRTLISNDIKRIIDEN